MQSTIRTITALFAGTALAGFSSPLLAQSAGPPQSEVDEVQDDQPDVASGDNAIVVTGTRIRGARIIGDTISLDRETIVEAGQIDLGEAIRSLPQNFSGGQNPGIGSGAGFANSNVNSASSANLRGLGPDATLTLLNGHRLPYDSAFAGVDISSIPLAAVDRIEVVPDGASALYGSDAVAGVVNVILRRDFEGITTSAQIGASTDGGNFRQQRAAHRAAHDKPDARGIAARRGGVDVEDPVSAADGAGGFNPLQQVGHGILMAQVFAGIGDPVPVQIIAPGFPERRVLLHDGDHFHPIPVLAAAAFKGVVGYRGVHSPVQTHDGKIVVDFNYAYNPYCAYNDQWSCPLTPFENHIQVPIRAGEKNFK